MLTHGDPFYVMIGDKVLNCLVYSNGVSHKMSKTVDYTGKVVDKLTIIRLTDERHYSNLVWLARCSCDSLVKVSAAKLKRGLKDTGLYCGDKSRHPELFAVYIGQGCGKLVIQSISVDKSYNVVAHCNCDCGGTKKALLSSLKSGNNKSCGCLLALNGNIVDIRGVRFGKLIAVRDTGKRSGASVIWECRCDCGGKAQKSLRHLTDAKLRDRHACKECTSKRRSAYYAAQRKAYIGTKVGINTILDVYEDGVLAECACGNVRRVIGALKSIEPLKYCEKCYTKNATDITNQRFGRLVALYPTDKRYKNSVVWVCQCDCGNKKEVSYLPLSSGNTKSCGCGKLAGVLIPNGTKVGDYTVVAPLEERSAVGYVVYDCKCRCGVHEKFHSNQLRTAQVIFECKHRM